MPSCVPKNRARTEGDWELLDSVSPVMTEGARRWIRDLAGQFAAAGIGASFAFSMEVYNPPAAMRAKYLHYAGGVVTPGNDVFLEVPSYQMHFGTRVRNYLRQMRPRRTAAPHRRAANQQGWGWRLSGLRLDTFGPPLTNSCFWVETGRNGLPVTAAGAHIWHAMANAETNGETENA